MVLIFLLINLAVALPLSLSVIDNLSDTDVSEFEQL